MKYSFLDTFKFPNKDITLKNRVVIPPLTECMAFHDGNVTEDEIN